ncbi:MAG TPA: hypothetical protein VHA80_01060 [Solirubrobacterales bacterium]|nr:hypothetical protein [Solirubrobacterales bacterium]
MVGERGTLHTPACLTCGWIGGDGTHAEAEGEAAMHERGERQPWQFPRGQAPRVWQPGDAPVSPH